MNVNWSKEEMKQYFMFTHQTKVLLRDKYIQLEMEVDVFNGHVSYNVTDGADIEYASFNLIDDAIDKFYEMKQNSKSKEYKAQTCILKEHLNCLYLTKENRDKVLKSLKPRLGEYDDVKIIEDNNKQVVVQHEGWRKEYYFYNHWYVRNYDCVWECYTDEEFKENFQLVEE